MMYWVGRLLALSVIAGSAVLIAFLLAHVAHYDIGLTGPEIRHSALIATVIIAMLLVV
jgi:hypothetical protein